MVHHAGPAGARIFAPFYIIQIAVEGILKMRYNNKSANYDFTEARYG
jgi:hypothetical protein